MLKLFRPVFIGVDKKKISDDAHVEDYSSAQRCDRVSFGKLCLYYRDLGKKYFVPYDYIDRAFTKVVVCPENEFANNEQYFRLILVHNGNEFANLIISSEDSIHTIYDKIRSENSRVIIGSQAC